MTNSESFIKCIERVFEHEGFYSNVTGDRGGETYRGIARNIHRHWSGWLIVDQYKMKHGFIKRNEEIKNERLDAMVLKFYFNTYWKKNGIDLIKDFSLQYIIFDWCVNSGTYGAKNVQKIVGVQTDGIIGNITAQAINAANPEELFSTIKLARINFYHKISKSGQNIKFLGGWLRRINSINYEAS